MRSLHRTCVKNELVRKLQNLCRYITCEAQKMLDKLNKGGFGNSRVKLLQYLVRNSTCLIADSVATCNYAYYHGI
jgi:predicted HAD superfamily phosphohydrolase